MADRSVQPIDEGPGEADAVLRWAQTLEALGLDGKRVRTTWLERFADGAVKRVSTVFLGLDHQYDPDPALPPLIFESMQFPGLGVPTTGLDDPNLEQWRDERCERYSTWVEAWVGHERMVADLEAEGFVQTEERMGRYAESTERSVSDRAVFPDRGSDRGDRDAGDRPRDRRRSAGGEGGRDLDDAQAVPPWPGEAEEGEGDR